VVQIRFTNKGKQTKFAFLMKLMSAMERVLEQTAECGPQPRLPIKAVWWRQMEQERSERNVVGFMRQWSINHFPWSLLGWFSQ